MVRGATGSVGLGRRGALFIPLALLAVTAFGVQIYDRLHATAEGRSEAPKEQIEALVGLPDAVRTEAAKPVAVADALSLNADVPFVKNPVAPAPAFRFTGSTQEHQRATECLALAAMAEAGGSDEGQRGVIQVVLNRVRHPAFAKSICGVVFQGSERDTGCQFSFTCDGALARSYSATATSAARRRAAEALSGFVLKKVGTATHYHTDWVYPYWSSSLDKVARIETHLFFRWKGYWGQPASISVPYRGGEKSLDELKGAARPIIEQEPAPDDIVAPPGDTLTMKTPSGAGIIKHPDGGAFLVSFAGKPATAQALATARRLCGGDGYCRVMGWVDRSAMPKGFPVNPASRAKLSFSYVLDDMNNETVQYDCRLFPSAGSGNCLSSTLERPE